MSKYYDQTPNGPDALVRRLESLEREVRELRAGRRLEASTIGRGGLTVEGGSIVLRDANGMEIGRMGAREDLPPDANGTTQSGFILRRTDGTVAFTVDDPNGAQDGNLQSRWALYDAGERIIFAEDAVTKFGLSAPQFSYQFVQSVDNPDRGALVTEGVAGGYKTFWTSYVPIFHSRYRVSALAQTWITSGTTSPGLSVRLVADGVDQGVKAVGGNAQAQLDWDIDGKTVSGGELGRVVRFDLQAYKTITLTNNATIAPWYFYTM